MRTRIPHLAPVALAITITITITTGCGSPPGGDHGPRGRSGGRGGERSPSTRPGRAVKKSIAQPVPPGSPTRFYD